ncbi:MAG: prepilin-type N-terminal cleavage/methylation domain-containing protein [Sedimentisphaeraceae bacterium JB056]
MVYNRKRGFTLVELLVVISIIALLMSILIPSLAKARESAKSVICKSNLKQLGSSIYLYVADNEGYLPIAAFVDSAKEGMSYQWTHWYNLISPYFGEIERGKASVLLCPSDPSNRHLPAENQALHNYCYNDYLGAEWLKVKKVKMSDVNNMANVIAFGDAITYTTADTLYTYYYVRHYNYANSGNRWAPYFESNLALMPYSSFAFRHPTPNGEEIWTSAAGVNICLLDGHVQTWKGHIPERMIAFSGENDAQSCCYNLKEDEN